MSSSPSHQNPPAAYLLRPITSPHIEKLSEETLLEILSYLSVSELLTASRISQRFNRLCDEPQLWRRIYHSLFTVDRLKHPFSPALDQRLRGSIESRSSRIPLDRKGKRKLSEATIDGQSHLGHTWKTLCRISLNWRRGSAGLTRITPVIDQSDSPSTSSQALTTNVLHRSQDSKNPTPNTIVRFHRSLLFIARKSRSSESLPTVYVYNLQNDFNHQQQKKSVLVGNLSPTEEAQDTSLLVGQGVTEISIDESCDGNSDTPQTVKTTVLISVFYTTGLFTLYEINLPSVALDTAYPAALDFQEVGSFQPSMTTKSSSSSKINHEIVEIAKFHFPLLVTCSVDFHLKFFRLSWSSTTAQSKRRLQIVKLPLDMQNHSCYWPLSLNLKRSEPLSERFQMTIAYPMPFYPSAWTVGMQEFDFEITTSRSSTSSSSLQMNTNRFITALQHPQDKDRRPMAGLSLGEIVIGIQQAAENVIVGRSDNTIDCFRLAPVSENSADPRKKRLLCSKTLFGHTSRIGSISVDESGRCVSGAMDGVKVWEGSEAVDVRSVESPTSAVETRRVGWIGSDSEKIVSLWIWEDLDSHGKTARLNEEVRVLSFI
ncbi:hypothetical protein PtA15_17A249 [Puccinia triticina]|uniref:F-box domain-containing protein n=1 Tax=Puccinia triticina TaxID=208348 RepID=A0ABY7D7Y8_9BASI|nr:uncharacterized protein PtA15_17A249 [Puccinia triticina]WAQ92767.1 hypothetical protein PtA15_17A249 [Puccinia triticina]